MFKKIAGNSIVQLFSILWALYLFLDYINHSQFLIRAFQYFEYTGLIVTMLILGSGFLFLFTKGNRWSIEPEIKNFRGIYHYLFVLLTMVLIVFFYLNIVNVKLRAGSGAFTFLFRTLGFHLELGLILFSSMCIGSYILDLLKLHTEKVSSALIGIALGLFILTLCMFILGSLGLLNAYTVFPLLILFVIPYRKKALPLLRDLLIKKSEKFKIHILAILSYIFLLILVSINLISVTRSFPIGYDGLNLYMNIAKLIAGYEGLVSGGDAYNWSLLMSLGFILYDNTVVAILISIVPGILSIIAIYKICTHLNLNRNWSLFSCVVYYSFPVTVWMSRNDEKTDLALLFITLCALLLLLVKSSTESTKKNTGSDLNLLKLTSDSTIWLICGILVGFSFGIKYLAMLNVFALLVLLFYSKAGKFAASAIFFLNFAVIYALDLTRFAAFKSDSLFLRFSVPFLIGLIFLVVAFIKNRTELFTAFKRAFIFLFAAGITFVPWAIKHVVENKKLSADSILTGKSALPALYSETNKAAKGGETEKTEKLLPLSGGQQSTIYAGFLSSNLWENTSTLLAQANDENIKKGQSLQNVSETYTNKEKEEEIRRHLGYETGIIRFISLPYDLAMKINVSVVASDPGILMLILLPFLMLVASFRQLAWNILKILFMIIVLILSMHSVEVLKMPFDYYEAFHSIQAKSFTELTSFKNVFGPLYVILKEVLVFWENALQPLFKHLTSQSLGMVFMLLSLVAFPLYFLYKSSLRGLNNISKYLIVVVYCVIQYWLVLSSGILWYGIVGFSLLPVIISVMATNENPDSYNHQYTKAYTISCTALWLILILPVQFLPLDFRTTKNESLVKVKEFTDLNFMKYAIGEKNEREVFGSFFNPQQKNIINTLNNDKKARILNVSTFLSYFITNNDIRIYKDNQLGIFNGIYNNAGNDKKLFASELKKTNIKYILVSLRAADIDITPDQSLKKKFNELMMALVNNPEIQLLYTDRLMERFDGDLNVSHKGQRVKAKYDVLGSSIINPGTDALFMIL